MTGKRIIIKSKARFTIFIAIIVIGAAIGINMLFNNITVKAEDNAPAYTTVEVCDGDTLWTIAERCDPNTDTREAVYKICELNNIDNGEQLEAGMTIKVPKEE
ncbi:MAG: LysM peptidoglycan-binding domain-containing protein [Anaerovoracaceae bacterium]